MKNWTFQTNTWHREQLGFNYCCKSHWDITDNEKLLKDLMTPFLNSENITIQLNLCRWIRLFVYISGLLKKWQLELI